LIWVALAAFVIGVGYLLWRVRWWIGLSYAALLLAVLNSV
jgi:hypothetical protein